MVHELESDNLNELINANKTVLVQYSAGWCGNCRLIKPKFKKFASENTQANFVLVDAEKFPMARKLAEVNNLPTFAAFKNGVLVKQVQTNKTEILKLFIDETTSN